MKKTFDDRDCAIVKNFLDILNKFYAKISSLRSSFFMTKFLIEHYSEVHERTKSFIKSKCEDVVDEKGVLHFKVPIRHRKQWYQLSKEKEEVENSLEEYPRSIFIHLISVYDHFFSQLLKCYLSSVQGSIMLCGADKHVSYQDVKDCSSLDELREKIIDNEIDILMRGSHTTQLEWLFSKVKGIYAINEDLIKKFVEMTERRNAFVHADGIVSKQYVNVCKQNKIKNDENVKIGSRLDLPIEYFLNSVNVLLELSSNLTIYLTKSLYKDCDDIDGVIAEHIFDCLQEKNYTVVQNISEYLKQWKLNNQNQMIVDVNYTLSFYLQDDEEKTKELLAQIDWSNCSIVFLLAKAVLEKKWKEAAAIMKEIGEKSKEIEQADYLTWPLFEKFRRTNEFAMAYKSLFGESFSSESSFKGSSEVKVSKAKRKRTKKNIA